MICSQGRKGRGMPSCHPEVVISKATEAQRSDVTYPRPHSLYTRKLRTYYGLSLLRVDHTEEGTVTANIY